MLNGGQQPSPRDRIMAAGRGQLRGPSACPAQRPTGVDQQLLRFRGGTVGQRGQLTGDAANHRLGLVAALRRT
jgi:hypothetical protein